MISVFALVGEFCVSAYDGDVLFHEIVRALESVDRVTIDFSGCTIGCSNFFSYSIARLNEVLSIDELSRRVQIFGLEPHMASLIKACNQVARRKADPIDRNLGTIELHPQPLTEWGDREDHAPATLRMDVQGRDRLIAALIEGRDSIEVYGESGGGYCLSLEIRS